MDSSLKPWQIIDHVCHALCKSRPQLDISKHIERKNLFTPYLFSKKSWRGLNVPGVYLIGCHYVGQSHKIGTRISAHASAYRRSLTGDAPTTACDAINDWNRLNVDHGMPSERVPVFKLSNKQEDEFFWAKLLKDLGFPILNRLYGCIGYASNKATQTEQKAIDSLLQKGWTISPPDKEEPLMSAQDYQMCLKVISSHF